MSNELKGTIYLAVLDFATVTVNQYQISEEEQSSISEEIDETDDDLIVQEFMSNHGHRESECNYMFSRTPIEAFIEGEKIN